MKHFPSELNDHLAQGATTLTWCWSIHRTDGTTLGFTQHNQDITIGSTVFQAGGVVTLSELSASVGLNRDPLQVFGALKSEAITQPEIEAGLYDDAKIQLWLVNWANPGDAVLYRTCSIGEIEYTAQGYTAQVLPLSAALEKQKGRTFLAVCDAELGDERCGIDLSAPGFQFAVTVVELTGSHGLVLTVPQVASVVNFESGLLSITSGAAMGFSAKIKSVQLASDGGALKVATWSKIPNSVVGNDGVELTIGCNKSAETCRKRFANITNFRGFPFMPGNDFVTSYPSRFDRDA